MRLSSSWVQYFFFYYINWMQANPKKLYISVSYVGELNWGIRIFYPFHHLLLWRYNWNSLIHTNYGLIPSYTIRIPLTAACTPQKESGLRKRYLLYGWLCKELKLTGKCHYTYFTDKSVNFICSISVQFLNSHTQTQHRNCTLEQHQ